MLTTKNAQAYAVLALVVHRMADDTEKYLCIEAYVNCREQGFSVKNYFQGERQVSFSENRNSDDIVVYYGNRGDFSMQGNVPSEEVYRKARYFACHNVKEAADFVYEYLNLEAINEAA